MPRAAEAVGLHVHPATGLSCGGTAFSKGLTSWEEGPVNRGESLPEVSYNRP